MAPKTAIIVAFMLLLLLRGYAQFDVSKIDIVRDHWGVPHIFGNTDADVAYGLAYAHSEDDFETIQLSFLAGKAMLGRLKGKDGAAIDYVVHLFRIPELVEAKYESDISPAYKKVLEGYCAGFNAYAASHPKEVLVKQLLPLTPKDMLCYSVLQLCVSSGADDALKSIYGGSVAVLNNMKPGGSNAFAFNSKITADGQTYLTINSHQPLEGPVAWYEAHLCSNEGWNIIGALFPGAPSILHGCNQYLGWAHTVNAPDKLDIYQLELNPANKQEYKFDGQWIKFEINKVHLNVLVAGITTIGVNKDAYWCKYGPVVITKKGAFAIRTPAMFEIRGLEEWYMLNKAKNYSEFSKILRMEAIPGYNIVYADRYDTIYYLSNGEIPIRNNAYNWKTTLPGNTSKTLWTALHPINDLPQVLQPASGYVYNTNNTPFHASGAGDNFSLNGYDETMGYEKYDDNRSLRFEELIKQYPKLAYDDMKRIKYDRQLPAHLAYMVNADTLFLLPAQKYPEITDVVKLLQQWDKKGDAASTGATLFCIIYYQVLSNWNINSGNAITTAKAIELYKYARTYLIAHFKTINVPLGDYQKLVRGNKALPLAGIPDVISAMYSVPYKNGLVRGTQGESYIELVRFTKDGPQIESVNCYGASNKSNSPHYADQAELFINQKTKPMTFDKAEIYKNAESIYHPK